MDWKLDRSIYTVNINLLAVVYSLILQSNMAKSSALVNVFKTSQYTMVKYFSHASALPDGSNLTLSSEIHSQLIDLGLHNFTCL